MSDKCEHCRTADAEIWIEYGSYGLGRPEGVCLSPECIEKAGRDLRDYADALREEREEKGKSP